MKKMKKHFVHIQCFLHFGFWMFILHIEFRLNLARNDSQMMFKHDFDHLSLNQSLPWMFEKK